jgi:hypothetical protein
MFWLFWQIVEVVVGLTLLYFAYWVCYGLVTLLVGAFTRSPAPRLTSALPAGWVSVKCEMCGKQYDGVNDFEAGKTLAWHMKAQHGVDVPSRFRSEGDLPVVLLGQIVEEKPVPGNTIYFAKCRICGAQFESFIPNRAESLRQNHMAALHELNNAARPGA